MEKSKMIYKNVMVSLILIVLILSGVGWTKPLDNVTKEADFQYQSGEGVDMGAGPLFTQYWDWENAIYACYENENGVVVDILLPWYVGSDTDIPVEIALDHKQADGWTLLYNFVDGTLEDIDGQPQKIYYSVPFFALYNRYRGIIRFFYLHNKETTYTDFLYGLNFDGLSGETTLLNFAEDFANSDEERLTRPFLHRANIKKDDVGGPILYHWHSFDVELTYDPQVEQLAYSDLVMRWLGRGIDVSQLTLHGQIVGNITGMIDIAGNNSSLNIGGLTFNTGTVDSYNTSVTINHSTGAAEKVKAKAQKQLNGLVKAKLNKLAGDLLGKAVNYFASPLLDIFGSFMGGSNKNLPVDNVNLRLEADIDLNGTMELKQPIFEKTLKVPGTMYGETDDTVVPYYDEPLGVLTISTAPEVVWEEWFEYGLYDDEYTYLQQYHIDRDSFDVILNPAVETELRIKTVKKMLYYYHTYKGATRLRGILYQNPDYVGATLVDSDPNNTIYRGTSALYTLYRNVYPILYEWWENGSMTHGHDQKVVVRVIVELERLDDPEGDPIIWSKTYRPEYIHDNSKNPVRYIDNWGEGFIPM